MRSRDAVAVGAGFCLGSIGRNLPVEIAFRLYPSSDVASCGSGSSVDCAFARLPDTIGALFYVGLIMLAVTAGCAIAGVLVVTLGVVRGRRHRGAARVVDELPAGRATLLDGLLLAIGVMLATPAIWLGVAIGAALIA